MEVLFTYLIIIVLVVFSAFFSGLTLGFFSLNKEDLMRKAELGDERAKKIYSLRKDGNLLLCTLLIGNVAVNSTLSIYLGSIASGVVAGLVATSLIVVLGEITPQAIFSRHALSLGSKFVWLVKAFEYMLFPICWPLAYILDKALGAEGPTYYSKKELVKLIEFHEDLKESELDADEEMILKGGLSYSEKRVNDIMTPVKDMFMLGFNMKLDKKRIMDIKMSGHSRIPVYKGRKNNVVGVLFVKDLIGHTWKNKIVGDALRKKAHFIDDGAYLDTLLNKFKRIRRHLFVVRNEDKSVVGLVTIEDVIEEIIGAEIYDEFDYEHEDSYLQK